MKIQRRVFLGSFGYALLPRTTLAQVPSEPYFLKHNPLWKSVGVKDANPVVQRFDLPAPRMRALIEAVYGRMLAPELAPVAKRPVREIAAAISEQVDAAAATVGAAPGPFARQWLLAEGVCRWTLLNVFYDRGQIGPNWVKNQEFAHWGKRHYGNPCGPT